MFWCWKGCGLPFEIGVKHICISWIKKAFPVGYPRLYTPGALSVSPHHRKGNFLFFAPGQGRGRYKLDSAKVVNFCNSATPGPVASCPGVWPGGGGIFPRWPGWLMLRGSARDRWPLLSRTDSPRRAAEAFRLRVAGWWRGCLAPAGWPGGGGGGVSRHLAPPG